MPKPTLISRMQRRIIAAVNDELTLYNGAPTTPMTAESNLDGRHVFTWPAHAAAGEPEKRVTVTVQVDVER